MTIRKLRPLPASALSLIGFAGALKNRSILRRILLASLLVLLAITGEAPKWNFHKYLVARDGRTVTSFGARTAPDDKALVAAIEAAIAAPAPAAKAGR